MAFGWESAPVGHLASEPEWRPLQGARTRTTGPRPSPPSRRGRQALVWRFAAFSRITRRETGVVRRPFAGEGITSPASPARRLRPAGEQVYSNTRRAPVLSSTVTAIPELSG